jgi:hypothetical protein
LKSFVFPNEVVIPNISIGTLQSIDFPLKKDEQGRFVELRSEKNPPHSPFCKGGCKSDPAEPLEKDADQS